MASIKVLQWNCRSIRSSSSDLYSLTDKFSPEIILLQETWLDPGTVFMFHNYKTFRLERTGRGGGLMILVSNNFCRNTFKIFDYLSSECEILGVDLHLPGCRPFSLINVYFPHGVTEVRPLDSALASCHKAVIVAGDFNSHHVSWGFRTDTPGRRLWEWVGDNNLHCFNAGNATFISGQSRSVLDLTFATSGMVSSLFTVDCETNSDHIPILFQIACTAKIPSHRVHSFVNINKFSTELCNAISAFPPMEQNCRAESVVTALKDSIFKAKFTVSSVHKNSCSPWWNDECTRDFRRRKAAWQQLLHNQSPANWINFKFYRATFKRTVSRAKETFNIGRFSALSQPNRRAALFKFIRSRKSYSPSPNAPSLVRTKEETVKFLNNIAQNLQLRFATRVPPSNCRYLDTADFEDVSVRELDNVITRLPASAPGPDGITAAMIKLLYREAPEDLLNIINTSLKNAWILPEWRLAKILPYLKKPELGYTFDNIRPIALTSCLVKVIERVLLLRINRFLSTKNLLNPRQIGFREGCSIWWAHIDLESRIHWARRNKHIAALVTLDISKAYDSVEYSILLDLLSQYSFPKYIIAWVAAFLEDRQFFCYQHGYASSTYKQTRGVPQGSVLSPVLFNVLLSAIPVHPDVQTYVYADDIAFFSSSQDIHSLFLSLQSYLNVLERWLDSLNFSLNVNKCAILVFPITDPISISLSYHQESIRQVDSLKYLGIIYDSKLNWRLHIEHVAAKGARAVALLKGLSHKRTGLRGDTLLMIYCMYVRPILEFGCVMFSGSATYKLQPLVRLERQALRCCLGLPVYCPVRVLYLEAGVPTLRSRFKYLTVNAFLKFVESPLARSQAVFLQHALSFFGSHWSRLHRPQVIFANSLLSPLNTNLLSVPVLNFQSGLVDITFDNIFPKNAKFLPVNILNNILSAHRSHYPSHVVIATDASKKDEKVGVGIFSPALNWSFSLRLPDYVPIFYAEFLALLLATLKLDVTQSSVMFLTDSLSVCMALSSEKSSPMLKTFYSCIPTHVREIRLIWLPGHCGLPLNEIADMLAKMALALPVIEVLPPFAAVLLARYRQYLITQDTLEHGLHTPELEHLRFRWKRSICKSRLCEVSLTSFRCGVPSLNQYLHRVGQSTSPLCHFCQEIESAEHFFLFCRRFSHHRKRLLETPLRRLGLPLTLPLLLSFGGTNLGYCHRDVCHAVHSFVSETARLPC